MVEGHPKSKRLSRSISTGSGGISPATTTAPTPTGGVTSRSVSVYSNLNLANNASSSFSGFPTTNNFVINPVSMTNANFLLGPSTSSSGGGTGSSNAPTASGSGGSSPHLDLDTPLVIQSGRKEARNILYHGIYQKFNRVFSAVNAFKMQKAKGSSVSGEYSRVATSSNSATVTPSTSSNNFQNLSGGK